MFICSFFCFFLYKLPHICHLFFRPISKNAFIVHYIAWIAGHLKLFIIVEFGAKVFFPQMIKFLRTENDHSAVYRRLRSTTPIYIRVSSYARSRRDSRSVRDFTRRLVRISQDLVQSRLTRDLADTMARNYTRYDRRKN